MPKPLEGFNRYNVGEKVKITATATGYVCSTTVTNVTIDDEYGQHRVLATDSWDAITVEPVE